MSLYVVAACAFEYQPLRAILADEKEINERYEMHFAECGIGALNAACHSGNMAKMLAGHDVIFIGSCGVFTQFTDIHLLTTDRAVWLPTCERLKLSQSIEHIDPAVSLRVGLFAEQLPRVTTLCCPAISLTAEILPDIAEKYQISNTPLAENLELYSMARALLHARSIHVVFAVTNQVGSEGRNQWKKNNKEAYQQAAEYIISELRTKTLH